MSLPQRNSNVIPVLDAGISFRTGITGSMPGNDNESEPDDNRFTEKSTLFRKPGFLIRTKMFSDRKSDKE